MTIGEEEIHVIFFLMKENDNCTGYDYMSLVSHRA